MKKLFLFWGLVLSIFLLSGCSNDSMDNITIYTSVYPIEYVTNTLYGEHAKIYNMYPQGINPYEYKLTNKQISDYSESNLIIYTGLSNEKKYIAKMVNKNKKLKIIDATSNIEYTTSLDDLWINPSNVLMLSQNIKEGLKEYISSYSLIKDINAKYEDLKIEISSIDAELKEIAENADNKTIIVQNDELNFLKKYGLNVISLDEKTVTDKIYSDAVNSVKDENIDYIFILKDEEENDQVKNLRKEYDNLNILYIDPINNISTSDKKEGIDYITIMNDNIDKLKQELY